MQLKRQRHAFAAMSAALILGQALPGHAQSTPDKTVVGKDGWLFYSNETLDSKWAAGTAETVNTIARFNRILADNDIALVVTMVPLKMRIYREHLSDPSALGAYGEQHYAAVMKALAARDVRAIDLNSAFLASPKRAAETPLYYRLDSHWSRPGALLASEVVKSALERFPPYLQALQGTPEAAYTLVEKKVPRPSQGRDLVSLLPASASAQYPPEAYPPILVQKPASKGPASLTGDSPIPRIALVGSSYSRDWTGFADFLRYQFQRDIGDFAVPANQGSWVGMMSLLRDGAFQKAPPTLVLWELPERDMHAPPNYAFREARYRFPNADWLLAAAAAVQKTCPASPASVRATAAGSPIAISGATAGMDFLDAKVVAANGVYDAEITSPAGKRRYAIPLAAGGVFRLPLTVNGQAATQVIVNGAALKLDAIRACRHPRDYAAG